MARDARDQARELEQLLGNADIPKPYVVVGHSWGGSLARLYAGTHEDVKAVMLIDASVPGQQAALAAALPPPKPNEDSELELLRHPPTGDALQNPENLAWEKSLEETGDVASLGDRPLIVITAGKSFGPAENLLRPAWMKLQGSLVTLSRRTVHIFARTSGHFVQTDDPLLVNEAVAAEVKAVRAGRPLPSCRVIFGTDAPDRVCLP